ncbi:MAG: tape measure protein [Rhodothermales bacterium]|nr:tape measure protein [Rhodothermales bacterium]
MAGAFQRVGIETDRARMKARRWGDETESAASRVRRALSRLRYLVAGSFLGVFFARASREVLALNGRLEQSRISFEQLLRGSGQDVDAFLSRLEDFAARTPFELAGLQAAVQRLLTFGFAADEVFEKIEAIGSAASAAPQGMEEAVGRISIALGQMLARGKVSAQEMNQLTEAGIPAWGMLARGIGRSTQEVMKLTEQGLIPARQAIEILTQGMQERFGGLMERQSRTFFGLLSTFRDESARIVRDSTAGLFSDLRADLQAFMDEVGRASESGELEAWGERIDTALRAAWRTTKAVASTLRDWAPVIARATAVMLPLVAGVKAYNVATRVATAAAIAYRNAQVLLAAAQATVAARSTQAAVAVKGFNAAVASSGIGALIAVLTSAGLAWVLFRDRTDEAAESMRRVQEETRKAITEIERMGGAMLAQRERELQAALAAAKAERDRIAAELAGLGERQFRDRSIPGVGSAGRVGALATVTAGQQREAERLRLSNALASAESKVLGLVRQQHAVSGEIAQDLNKRIAFYAAEEERLVGIVGALQEGTAAYDEQKATLEAVQRMLADLRETQQRLARDRTGGDFPGGAGLDLEKLQEGLGKVLQAQEAALAASDKERRAIEDRQQAEAEIAELYRLRAGLSGEATKEEREGLEEAIRLARIRITLAEEALARSRRVVDQMRQAAQYVVEAITAMDSAAQVAVRRHMRSRSGADQGSMFGSDGAIEPGALRTFTDADRDAIAAIARELERADEEGQDLVFTLRTVAVSLRALTRFADTFGNLSDDARNFALGLADALDNAKELSDSLDRVSLGDRNLLGKLSLIPGAIGAAAGIASAVAGLVGALRADRSAREEEAREQLEAMREQAERMRELSESLEDHRRTLVRAFGEHVGAGVVGEGVRGYDVAAARGTLASLRGTPEGQLTRRGIRSQLQRLVDLGVVDQAILSMFEDLLETTGGNLAVALRETLLRSGIDGVLDLLSRRLGDFGSSLEGMLREIEHFGLEGGEALARFLERMASAEIDLGAGLEELLQGRLAGLDLSTPAGREALAALLDELRGAFGGGRPDLFEGVSPGEMETLVRFLEGLLQPGVEAPGLTRSVQIARSITELQASEVVILLEELVYIAGHIAHLLDPAFQPPGRGSGGGSGGGGTGGGGPDGPRELPDTIDQYPDEGGSGGPGGHTYYPDEDAGYGRGPGVGGPGVGRRGPGTGGGVDPDVGGDGESRVPVLDPSGLDVSGLMSILRQVEASRQGFQESFRPENLGLRTGGAGGPAGSGMQRYFDLSEWTVQGRLTEDDIDDIARALRTKLEMRTGRRIYRR